MLTPSPEFHAGFVSRVFQQEAVFTEAIRTSEGTKMPRTSWARIRDLRVFVPNDEGEQRCDCRKYWTQQMMRLRGRTL